MEMKQEIAGPQAELPEPVSCYFKIQIMAEAELCLSTRQGSHLCLGIKETSQTIHVQKRSSGPREGMGCSPIIHPASFPVTLTLESILAKRYMST